MASRTRLTVAAPDPAAVPSRSAGANPQRRGLPKRAPSLTKLVDDLVDELGGDRSINRCATPPPTPLFNVQRRP
jgi:hypothetical protein